MLGIREPNETMFGDRVVSGRPESTSLFQNAVNNVVEGNGSDKINLTLKYYDYINNPHEDSDNSSNTSDISSSDREYENQQHAQLFSKLEDLKESLSPENASLLPTYIPEVSDVTSGVKKGDMTYCFPNIKKFGKSSTFSDQKDLQGLCQDKRGSYYSKYSKTKSSTDVLRDAKQRDSPSTISDAFEINERNNKEKLSKYIRLKTDAIDSLQNKIKTGKKPNIFNDTDRNNQEKIIVSNANNHIGKYNDFSSDKLQINSDSKPGPLLPISAVHSKRSSHGNSNCCNNDIKFIPNSIHFPNIARYPEPKDINNMKDNIAIYTQPKATNNVKDNKAMYVEPKTTNNVQNRNYHSEMSTACNDTVAITLENNDEIFNHIPRSSSMPLSSNSELDNEPDSSRSYN